MRIAALASRHRGPMSFWALAGAALLVSHDAVYLVQTGPGEPLAAALRTASHDYWGAASLGLIAVTLLAGAASLVRLALLRHEAAALGATRRPQRGRLGHLLAIWVRLAALVVVGFAIQENVEHFITHGHLIGSAALVGPEYPLALPALGIVSLVAALAAALIVTSERALVAAIRVAMAAAHRPERRVSRPPQRLPGLSGSVLARYRAGRAPPSVLPVSS
jgi:hypothetical protein